MQNLKIELLKEETEIDTEFIDELTKFWPLNFEEEIKNPIKYINVCSLNGKTAGLVLYQIVNEEAEIHLIFVKKEYRNKRIGTVLLNNAIENCFLKNAKIIFLEVSEENLAALNLYKKFGFKIVGRREKYYKNKENALIMALKKENGGKNVQERRPKETCKRKVSPLCNT